MTKLSIYDLAKSMGVSRSTLRHYVDLGLIGPYYTVDDSGFHFYDTKQADDIWLVKSLFEIGLKSSDIVSLFGKESLDLAEMLKLAEVSAAKKMRETRHAMQGLAYLYRMVERMDAIGTTDGWYVRRIPSRMIAIMPEDDDPANIKGHLSLNEYLRAMAKACGWATTISHGTMQNFDAEGAKEGNSAKAGRGYSDRLTCRRCLFIELSSIPMPRLTHSLDCGCYRMAEGFDDCKKANSEACTTCARAGDPWPDPPDASMYDIDAYPSIALSAQSLESPQLSGPWAQFSHVFLQRSKSADDDAASVAPTASVAVAYRALIDAADCQLPAYRPYRMPYIYRLPANLTAAVLPEGLYLCKQHNAETGSKEAFEKSFLDGIAHLQRCSLSENDETDLVKAFAEGKKKAATEDALHEGPVTEPFLHSPYFAEHAPASGNVHPVDADNLQKVKIMQGTLFDTKGFFVLNHRMMFSKQPRVPIYERQVPILSTGDMPGIAQQNPA